jgi:hypothetical protein
MTWQRAFRVIIRIIFIFAYIAFLAASIRHVATFFHNFEADPSDWVNPYTLAVSIDLTALVLTIGVMFFRANMPWYAQTLTWLFIIALTTFSWFVNWEYAMTYQGNALHVNDTLRMLNPILASSFAFLNLAYSVVAEFFSSKNETAAELAAKVDELESLEEQQQRLAAYKERTKRPSIIQRAKNTALEARDAVNEVLSTEEEQEEQAEQKNTDAPVRNATIMSPAPAPQNTKDKQPFITEPLTMQADQYITNNQQDNMEQEADTAIFGLKDRGDENEVILPAWAGGEDVDTFLTAEDIKPDLPFGDTASMSKISTATGKLTRRKPMTVSEAAEALALSERRVRELRSQGTLITDDSNKIKVASVNAYMDKRRVRSN